MKVYFFKPNMIKFELLFKYTYSMIIAKPKLTLPIKIIFTLAFILVQCASHEKIVID